MSATFTVDTHVFRELGELLVGRDSTALIELIKNSYDADATQVTIFAQSLNDPQEGYILVSDDGIGMTEAQFRDGFLRIASRGKEEGERRSIKFRRKFTGAKGIGRLAAHKLAKLLSISSFPAKELGNSIGVEATIDWESIERYETLDELAHKQSDAITIQPKKFLPGQHSGTEIRLERLRKAWTASEMTRFISEVQSFSPPEFLVYPDKAFIRPYSFLFETAKVADHKRTAPFVPKLQGEFSPGDDYWKDFATNADWFIEIDCVTDPQKVRYQLTPSKHFRETYPDAKMQKHSVDHPGPQKAPNFQARIIVREGTQGKGPLKSWASNNFGVRVFMEGFRVLPYGERSNDWLQLDRHYVERMRSSEYLKGFGFEAIEGEDRNALLVHLGNRNYYGAVFLTQERSENLRMLVNREGFVPDSSFDRLSDLIRLGIDLTTRARAAAKFQTRKERGESRKGDAEPSAKASVGSALEQMVHVRTAFAQGDLSTASRVLTEAEATFRDVGERVAEENAMLRILASVGSQMAAFVHEINSTLGMAQATEVAISRMDTTQLNAPARRELAKIQKALSDLRRQLERQASYLVDIVTTDARRRRTRNSFADRFDAATRLLARTAANRNIEFENRIESSLKSLPMFPAELTAVFSNLLTNSIKAVARNGKIRASSKVKEGDHIIIRIENTGAEIDLSDAERWFLPFESTTSKVDAVLGQGMGLGLTITRNILEQYGAEIKFVRPNPGFSTALEMKFPLKA